MAMGSLNVQLNAKEINKLKAVAEYIVEQTFTPPVDVLIGERAEQLPMKYSAVQRTGWNAAQADVDEMNLPAQIWDMPADFSNLTARPVQPSSISSEGAVYYPRANLMRMVKDKDTDRFREEGINHFLCATKLSMTIRRIESPGSVFGNYTYELVGVRESDMPLLERLMRHVQANPADLPVRVKLLYKEEAGRNELSGSDHHWMFIQKANCSIETNPSVSGFLLEDLTTGEPYMDLFIRRLWEGSVTRAGGFYLFHYDAGNNTGLPEGLFENQGEVEVRMLFLFLSAGYRDGFAYMRPYFNAIVTGSTQDTDEERSSIHVRLDQRSIELPTDGLSSLQQLACTYFADTSLIAEANKLLPLAEGLHLQINEGTYMVREAQPDDSASIALSLGIKENDLLSVNPGLRRGDKLEPSTAVRLPPINVETVEGDHLEAISHRYGIPVAAIGADNQHLYFASGGTLELSPATRNRIGITPPGAVELRAERPAPEEWTDGVAFSAEQYLGSMFQMLQPRINGNFFFSPSQPGLPAGPKVSETEQFTNFYLADSPDRWQYSRTVPYAAFAEESARRLGEVPLFPGSNPYGGAGRMLQLELQWLDLFGNRIRSGLDDFSADSRSPNRAPVLVGYSDALLGLSKWPFVTADYVVERDPRSSTQLLLKIHLSFDATPFQKSDTVFREMVCKRAQDAMAVYRTIMGQLLPYKDGNRLGFQWETSLLPGGRRDLSEPDKLFRMLRRIWDWLIEIASNPDIFVDPGINEILQEAIRHQDINTSNLFELTVDVLFARPLAAVSPLFRSSKQVFEASTRILARRSIESNSDSTRSLRKFAMTIERALIRDRRYYWKLAVGSDRNRAAQSRTDQSVWLVRIAAHGSEEGLRYKISEKEIGNPAIYSPKPIVNRSELFEYEQSWSYSSKEGDEGGFKIDMESQNKVQKNRESMEAWAKLYLGSVDRMLSPKYCSAMGVIRKLADPNDTRDYGQEMITLKKRLAGVVSGLLDYVYRDDHPGEVRLAYVREIYRQRLLKELSNAYSIGAAIQFEATQSSGAVDREQPSELCRLYGSIVPGQAGDHLPAGFSLTNARLPMERSTEGEMNRGFVQFVLSGSRVGAGAVALPSENTVRPFVELDVGYLPTHIEHQIEVLRYGEEESPEDAYQASSWLHFIVPPQENDHQNWALYQSLGSFPVPLILRAFPEEPQFVTQSFADPLKVSAKQRPLADLLKWDYRFTYRRNKHYTQDRVYFHVKFNEMITEPLAFADMPDLCTQLARFNDVYGLLEHDLNVKIDMLTEIPLASNGVTQHIERIFKDYLKMANFVAESWVNEPEPANFLADDGYRFHLSETGILDKDHVGEQDYLVVRLKELTQPPDGMKPPVVVIKGYRSILRGVTGQMNPDSRTMLYTYEYAFQEENGTTLLSAYDGQTKPEREVVLPDLNIVVNQNACLYSYITRNEELIDGRLLAESYVYRTGEKRMARPLKPYLVRTEQIEIAEISGGVMPLEEHLSAFFKALFAGCEPNSTQKVQLENLYSYRISQRSFRPSLPIALLPPLEMELTKLYDISDNWTVGRYNSNASLVCNLTSRLWRAFSEYPPRRDDGSIDFKLTIMSNRTTDDVRLADFQAVTLDIRHVDPSPPLYDKDCDNR